MDIRQVNISQPEQSSEDVQATNMAQTKSQGCVSVIESTKLFFKCVILHTNSYELNRGPLQRVDRRTRLSTVPWLA